MYTVLAVTLIVTTGQPPLTTAEAEVSISDRARQIEQSYQKKLSEDRNDRSAMYKARNERAAALKTLVKDVGNRDPKTLTLEDHMALAQVYPSLGNHERAVAHCRAVIELKADNPSIHRTLISSLAASKQVDEAEKVFQTAREKFPDSSLFNSLQYTLARAHRRAGNKLLAAEHYSGNLDYQRQLLAGSTSSTTARYFGRYVEMMISAYADAEKPRLALDELQRQTKALEALAAEKPELAALFEQIRSREITLLADVGQPNQADELLKRELESAEVALADHPDEVHAVLRVGYLLQAKSDLAAKAGKKTDNDEAAFHDFVEQQTKRHADHATVIGLYADAKAAQIRELLRTLKVTVSAEAIRAASEFLDSLDTKDVQARSRIATAKRAISSYTARLDRVKVLADLIGKPGFSVEADAWVNGSPLAEDDLKGKVVLLDFWAMWCGPCIATFPHLREWQAKYEKDGFVIVGLTRYYNCGWSKETGRTTRIPNLEPEKEQAALVEFAKHHELHHRFAVMPKETTLPGRYGVSGIPQVVLLDRHGKIRLIRVGSGADNAGDTEEMIEELLAEPSK